MSLAGYKIYLRDTATALSLKLQIVPYSSDIPLNQLRIENIKQIMMSLVIAVDVWWASKPYIRIVIDKIQEDILVSQFKFKRVGGNPKGKTTFLIDICSLSGEPISRFMRAKDLECSIDQVYLNENLLLSATLLETI